MGDLGLWRRLRWDGITWTGRSWCHQGYWCQMNLSGKRMFCNYLFRCTSCISALIGMRLSWFLGKIIIEFIHYGGRLCNVFLADVAMFDHHRTYDLLVELQTWWFVWLVEVTARTGLVISYHCSDTFTRYPPLWWVLHRGGRICGRAGASLRSTGWRGWGWGSRHLVCCDWMCWGWKSQRLLYCLFAWE